MSLTPKHFTLENLTIATGAENFHLLVDDLSLEMTRGRVLALVGASGSGKSLSCSAALGVLPPGVARIGGRILVDGEVRPAERLRGRTVATIMQNPRSAFNPVKTMREHVMETLTAIGRSRRDAEGKIEAALREVGLDEPEAVLGLYPFEMSGGMLQRMMIAIALLSEAPFLVADEPTTDLDVVVQMRILALLEGLVREHDLGVLLVTHDMGVVARLADDVAVLDHGRLVETASVDEIFHRPKHPVTRMLVGAHLARYGMELAE